jgi:hypothetical protein
MSSMIRLRSERCLGLLLVLSAAFTSSALAQETSSFAGDWVLRLGNRVFIVVTLVPAAGGGGHFTGSLLRPQHFSTGGGEFFSDIKGPAIHYPIVRSSSKENCLSFTTQNPADRNDEDNFRLCITGEGRGSLKIELPTFEPWPVTKEKGPLALAADWESTRNYFLDDTDVSNSKMQRIFEEDQRDRQLGVGNIDWAAVGKADAARREATRNILASGKLHTGEDFQRAAFVFQHGDTPDDYLLAHTLAMVAVARGQSGAIWIAAATLDRYLNSIHQPQIYGTQFFFKPNELTTQEPYNRSLIPDALRHSLGVPSQARQEEQRKQYDAERSRH